MPVPSLTWQTLSRSAFGMLRGGKNLRDDDVGTLHAGDGNALDLGAGERELVEHLRYGNGEIEIMAEPAEREFHGRKKRVSSMRTPLRNGKVARLRRSGASSFFPRGHKRFLSRGTFSWRLFARSGRLGIRSQTAG